MAIMLHQSNHQHFLMKVCSYRKVEVQYCDKRSSFPGVTARSGVISHISIDFHAKKVIEFTTTAVVFKRELFQHITAGSKLF